MDRARQTDQNARPAATSRRGRRATSKAGPIPNTCTLAIVLSPDGSPPAEFRLFVSGWNDTENGRFLFDAEAASSVMSAHAKWGVDLMIDLEHQALNSGTPAEPNARDARGWFRLDLRPDGSLWAVNVTWTPDGAQRLADKRQRYVSPAFSVDPETARVTAIINCALVAIPATHDTPALVAASLNGASMDPKLITDALDALVAGDAKKSMEILKGLIAAAAGGAAGADPDATTEDAPPPVGDGGKDEATEMAVDPPPPKPEEDKPAEMAAALSAVATLSGKASFVASVADIRTWHASHVKLEEETKKLAAREAVLESAERRKLCVELVTMGGHRPSTVWADDKSTAPKPYLLSMPIADLRAMHADAVKASGGKAAPAAIKPPASGSASADGSKDIATESGDVVTLSAREVRLCGNDPARMQKYAATRAGIRARNVNGTGV